MSDMVKFNQVEDRIINLRNQPVLLDSDVAELYGVETREINQAVRNNPAKFPSGYILELDKNEWTNLKSNFLTSSWGGKNKLPKAFTKKGCYMLATILKSEKATKTTIEIIEAFEKVQDMTQSIAELIKDNINVENQNNVLRKSEELFGDIVGKALDTVGTETSFELNLAALKIKHTVKRGESAKLNTMQRQMAELIEINKKLTEKLAEK
jgi:phage regulator Rha-like protein